MKIHVLCLLFLAPITAVSAKVLSQQTSINAGWIQEISTESEASNFYNRNIVSVQHRTIADWGMVQVKGQWENLGAMSNTLEGNEGDVWFKVSGTAYYNISDSGFSAWYDLFVNQNQVVAEQHNLLGFAYGNRIGKVRLRAGLAMNYFSGHTPLGKAEGFITPVFRFTANTPLSGSLQSFVVFNAHLNRDTEALKSSFSKWEEKGNFLLIGLQYQFSPDWSLNIAYRSFNNWGGYTEGGQSLVTTIGYNF